MPSFGSFEEFLEWWNSPEGREARGAPDLFEHPDVMRWLDLLRDESEVSDADVAAAFVVRGVMWADAGEYDRAIEAYDKALEVRPDYALAYYNRGLARYGSGDPDGAIADFTKAIELDPEHAEALNNRGAIRAQSGDLAGAVADFTRAVELTLRTGNKAAAARLFSNLGSVGADRGDLDDAVANYGRAIELDPDCVDAYYNWACALAQKGDREGMLQKLTKAIELDAECAGDARDDEEFKEFWDDPDFRRLVGG